MVRGARAACAALVLALSLSACGGSSTSSSGSSSSAPAATSGSCSAFKKVGIGARVAVAYIAFRKWLYDPWRAGKFDSKAPGRRAAIVKGVAAALVSLHEARVAMRHALQCGAGKKVGKAFDAIQGTMTSLRTNAGTATNGAVARDMQDLAADFIRAKLAAG